MNKISIYSIVELIRRIDLIDKRFKLYEGQSTIFNTIRFWKNTTSWYG